MENAGTGFKGGWLKTELKDAEGNVVAREMTRFNIFTAECITIRQRIYLKNPRLWDLDDPYLYTYNTSIEVDDNVVDSDENTFGIRCIELDPVNGFQLNGKTVKMKGGCIHHDNGLLGSATFEDAEYRRVKFHKEAGYNALRSSHQPMSKAMLDACDKLGMLVMDEFSDVWTTTKCDYDYGFSFTEWWEKDVELMVKRGYNHPSIVMYSIGNEIPEIGSEFDASWGRKIAEKIRSLDNTRFITNGLQLVFLAMGKLRERAQAAGQIQSAKASEINQMMNSFQSFLGELLQSPEISAMTQESCGILDIVGYNYATSMHEKEQDISPNRLVIGTETRPQALDENWELVEKHGFILGDFSWTSWDYLGEVGIGHVGYDDDRNPAFYGTYPWISAYCADFDITGSRRPQSYWREIIWGGRGYTPYIAVQRPQRYGQTSYPGMWSWTDSISSWTWPGYEDKGAIVEVYSNAEEIELLVNNESLGKKPVGDDYKKFYCKWDTVYKPGEVCAVAYVGGKEVGRYSMKTAGTPMLKVTKESDSIRALTNDLCYVNVELVDSDGILNTAENKKLTFSLEGPAILQASGSGNPRMEEYYYDNVHETFYGKALAIVRAGEEKGSAKLTVSADGMESATVEIPVV